MASVNLSTKLPAGASMVWDMIGGFNALPNWHPAVERSEVEEDKRNKTTTRKLHLVGGGTIVEKLEQIDPSERLYSYSILESPLPITNYAATIRVKETGEGCEVHWSSNFEADGAPENEAIKIIQDIYQTGFENLQKMFGG